MGSKHGTYLGHFLLKIEDTGAGHPFMELGNDAFSRSKVKPGKALNDLAHRISEEGRFNIIPLSGERIKLIGFPQLGKNMVFLRKVGSKVHQDSHR